MKNLIEYFLSKDLLVNLVSLIILVAGIFSVILLKKETFPKVDFGFITVTTILPSSSPEDVEKLVTIPLEREIKGIQGIDEVQSVSTEGKSVIIVKVEADADTKVVLRDVKNATDRAIFELPSDAETPSVYEIDNRDPVVRVALYGLPESQLKKISKMMRDGLEKHQLISKVSLDGYRDEEIFISVNLNKINQYDLTVQDISEALRNKNLNLTTGKIETGPKSYYIRVEKEIADLKEVKNLIIRSNESGQSIKLQEIADVTRRLKPGMEIHRAEGQRAIFLVVTKKESMNITDSVNVTKKFVKDFIDENQFTNLKYAFVDDYSFYVKRRLSILTKSGLIGIVLVFFCLLLFLNFRVSVVTCLSVPIAFMAAFMMMDVFDITINLISMFGLIMVLGMLVDDSIIVSEHFYHHLERGLPPKKAALTAAVATIRPVLATIITTIIAFGSLFFMGGIMGKFLWPVPAVIIVCLLASLIECFFILPSHLALIVKPKEIKEAKEPWYKRFQDLYGKVLKFALRHYIIVCVSFFVVLMGAIFLITTMRFELFPGDDIRIIYTNIQGKVGDSIQKTEEAMKSLDKVLSKKIRREEKENIRSVVGAKLGHSFDYQRGDHYGMAIIYLTPPGDRERSTDDILNEVTGDIKAAIPGYEFTFKKVKGGPPTGKAVQVDLSSDSLDDLLTASDLLRAELSQVPGVYGTDIDYEVGKQNILVDINEAEANRLGLTNQMIARQLRTAYSEEETTKVRQADEDLDIVVQLREKDRLEKEKMLQFKFLNRLGQRIPLYKVADLKIIPGSFLIRHLHGKRTLSVSGEIDRKITTPVEVGALSAKAAKRITKEFSGMTFAISGENKDTNESLVRLSKSAIIALFCIFLVLVAMFNSLFQPFIIMLAIPLGIIGVAITFKAFGMSFSFMAMLGIVGLVGVVVNDSIVLVNFINKKIEKNSTLLVNAIHEASISRFRAVVLTTVTTVAGLLPIAHARNGDPFLKPMAISFAYGLLFSSVVTLIYIPCAYLFYKKMNLLREKIMRKKNKRKPKKSDTKNNGSFIENKSSEIHLPI